MTLKEMHNQYGKNSGIFKNLFPPVICKDGTFMSVQAGSWYHCTPQQDLDTDDYEEYEVRTSLIDARLIKFGYDENEYGYVPNEIIDDIINQHGGIDLEAINEYLKNNS